MRRGRRVAGWRAELGLGIWGLLATVWGMGSGSAQGGGSELVTLGKRTQSCELGCQGRGRGGMELPRWHRGGCLLTEALQLCLCP